MTRLERPAAIRTDCWLPALRRITITHAVTNAVTNSAATLPIECARSARASCHPRRNASAPFRPSMTTAGTDSPIRASQRTGMNGAGSHTTSETARACISVRRSGVSPFAITHAATKTAALTKPAPTAIPVSAQKLRNTVLRTTSAAGPTPSANEGQNRLAYRRIVSATSCPTVRVSGGSGGGSSRRFFTIRRVAPAAPS
jgi:hypothetical protein